MPIQHYSADNTYLSMSCHVFALSGDPATMGAVNTRYSTFGNYLDGTIPLPSPGALPGLVNVTGKDVKNVIQLSEPGYRTSVLKLLCKEFGFVPSTGSSTRLYGVFKKGQKLPMHMYVTCNNMVYDTLVDASIRKDTDNGGTNPPSETEVLDNSLIASIGVTTLAQHTMAVINAPAPNWADGL